MISKPSTIKFDLDAEQMTKALRVVNTVIKQRTPMAILQCVLWRVHAEYVELCATDLDVYVAIVVPKVHSLFAVVGNDTNDIPFEILTAGIGKLPVSHTQAVEVSVSEDHVDIVTGVHTMAYERKDVNDYPVFPECVDTQSITVSMNRLRTGLSSIGRAVGTDEMRPALCGIHTYIHNDQVHMEACSGHVLGIYNLCVSHPNHLDVIISGGVLNVMRLLDYQCDVAMTVNAREMGQIFRFKSEYFDIRVRCVGGSYPNVWSVIPDDLIYFIDVDAGTLLGVLKDSPNNVNTVSIGGLQDRIVDGTGDVTVLSILGLDTVGDHVDWKSTVHARLSNTRPGYSSIHFNKAYLMNMLMSVGSGVIHIQLTADNTSAIVVRPSSGLTWLVMPIRVR